MLTPLRREGARWVFQVTSLALHEAERLVRNGNKIYIFSELDQFNLERDQRGFYAQREIGVSSKEGIFIAGTCQGPMDIPQTITHAKAAVGQILQYLAL